MLARHKEVKAAIERHLAMVLDTLTDGCLASHNGTAKNLQTRWWCKGTGAPPPEPSSSPPGKPPAPPAPSGDNKGAEIPEIEGVSPRYVYIHIPLPNAQFVNRNAFAKDCKCDQDFIPDLLTDEGTTTGYYTICCMVMKLTFILQMKAVYGANLKVKMSIDYQAWDF